MKKYISLILALILVIAVFPLSSFAEDEIVTNGDISDTVHFTLDTAKKTLTIGGTGAIPAIPMNDVNPWSRNSYATTIIIETGITEIGDYAFYQNTYVKKVVMSDTVKKIGKSAFSGCKAITSLTLSGALESIGERAFINCTGISSITLAATLKRIEDSAFYGCSKITALSLPANLDYLDASAFTGTGYYKNLPSGLPVLDGYTLQYKGTPTGTTVTVPSGTRIISANTLASSSKVSTIEIPSSVEKILRMAFYDLTALHTVTVPDSVKEIGTFALGYVSDTTFAVPVPASSYKICGHVGSEAERYLPEVRLTSSALSAERRSVRTP